MTSLLGGVLSLAVSALAAQAAAAASGVSPNPLLHIHSDFISGTDNFVDKPKHLL